MEKNRNNLSSIEYREKVLSGNDKHEDVEVLLYNIIHSIDKLESDAHKTKGTGIVHYKSCHRSARNVAVAL